MPDASLRVVIGTCPLCSTPTSARFVTHGYTIQGCTHCGHEHTTPENPATHVAQVYDDSYFTGGAAGYADYLAEAPLLLAHGRRYARLLSDHLAPGRMLDIGAAAGFILEGFTTVGWHGEGIEPNARMAAAGRSRGLVISTGAFEDLEPSGSYDLVLLIQVIAHLIDPVSALARVRGLLRPGGLVLVETWDRRSLTARLFGHHWHEYSPPSVLHWFSRRGLREAGAGAGLELVARGVPGKWIGAAHAKSLLAHVGEHSRVGRLAARAAQVIPDRARLPYPAEDLFWMLLRRPATR